MKHLVFLAGSEQQKAASRLLAVSKLINPAVGDALSGMLLVEAILQYEGWSIHRWSQLYHDLPSKQLKVVTLITIRVFYLLLLFFLTPYLEAE